jgi:hypothetical protein
MEKAVEIDLKAFETWKQLYARWHEANQLARKARGEATVALMKCAYRKGAPPRLRELDNVSKLENAAEWLRLEMDAQILSMFTAPA